MSQPYEYQGEKLTVRSARSLIVELFGEQNDVPRQKIIAAVDKAHISRGGLLATKQTHPVDDALWFLKEQGYANNKKRGFWTISVGVEVPAEQWKQESIFIQEPGGRKGYVYLFYDPRDKQKAESENKHLWACKIGMTEKSVEDRVSQQTNQWTVKPVIGLVFQTDRNELLEKRIHNILRLFNRDLDDLKGREWFETSPDEVVDIYRFITKLI